MDTLVLRSTYKGFVSVYFWCLVWILAVYIFQSWVDAHLVHLDEFRPLYALATMAYWVSYPVMGLIGIILFGHLVYAPLSVYTFRKDGGWWKHQMTVTYDFPFSKKQSEVFFDRIVDAKVEQASIDRIFGTGSLTLKSITYTNGEVYESEHTINGIDDPYSTLETILRGIPSHTGIEVRWKEDPVVA